ncbi:MAG: hypothetical protein V8Q57_05710 [Blautia sp.]
MSIIWDAQHSDSLCYTLSWLQYLWSTEGGSEVWLKDDTVYLSLDFKEYQTWIPMYMATNRIAIQKDSRGVCCDCTKMLLLIWGK